MGFQELSRLCPVLTTVHVYGMVVDWKERVDQHSTADGIYYEVR
jgi:hypothetical protein